MLTGSNLTIPCRVICILLIVSLSYIRLRCDYELLTLVLHHGCRLPDSARQGSTVEQYHAVGMAIINLFFH